MHTICRTLWSVTLAWALLLITACQASSTGGGGGATTVCGNFVCEGAEAGYCPQDCGAACPAACSAAVCTAGGEIQDCITDAKGCKVLAAPKACANGNACTSGSCGGGGGSAPVCGDGQCKPGESTDSCPSDCPAGCQPACDWLQCDDGCGGTCEGQGCDDGKPCTTETICKNGNCSATKVKDCDDKNACTTDGCDAAGGCTHSPGAGGGCSDGDPCTTGDKCSGGNCIGVGKASCDDADPCTVDMCKSGAGCSNTPAADGTACGGTGICVAGGCCTCPAGQYCNASGTCISANSCKGKCGQYDKNATCQCDPECTQYGDCCTDYAGVCSSCTPGAFANCCDGGKSLCYYDSCGNEEPGKKEPCAFGCEGAAPGQMFDMCKADPCSGVSGDGECLSKSMFAYCAVSTGDGAPPELEFDTCKPWEECDDSYGFAWCAPSPTACEPGTAECVAGAGMAKRCVDGAWKQEACAGCSPTGVPGNVACPGSIALVASTGSITFEYVGPKAGYSGFDLVNTEKFGVIHGLVYSVRYSADYSQATVLDVATTGPGGSVTIKVPQQSDPASDVIVLLAAGYDAASKKIGYVIANPDVPDGAASIEDPLSGDAHSWAVSTAVFKSGGSWHISLAEGGWALQTYDAVRYAVANSKNMFVGPGKTLVVWARAGTDFDCGACFGSWPAEAQVAGLNAQSQIWLSTKGFKIIADPTIYHEVGHWAMSSFGTSPGEGGTHYAGTKVPPGMAWSEGWATFFSSMARADGVYYSEGGNGMFWTDLGKLKYSDGDPLLPFTASGGLTQFMDENRVAAALWNSAVKSQEPFKDPGNQGFWKALISNQMNNPPFTRPYNRQTWDSVKGNTGGDLNATYTGLKQTNQPAPTFPAYLDALLCAAPQLKSAVTAAIAPLPFPVNTPICKP